MDYVTYGSWPSPQPISNPAVRYLQRLMRKVARMRIMKKSTEATWRIYLQGFLQSFGPQTPQIRKPSM